MWRIRSGIDDFEFVVAETKFGEGSRTHSFDDDIGARDQFSVEVGAFVGFEIKGDAALAAMGVEVKERDIADHWPGHLPDIVAAWRFDLDDISAEVGKKRPHLARSEQT